MMFVFDLFRARPLTVSLSRRLRAAAFARRRPYPAAEPVTLAADGEPPLRTPEDYQEVLDLEHALDVVLDDLRALNDSIKGGGKTRREAVEPQRRHLLRRMKRLQGALDRGGRKELQRQRIVVGRMFETLTSDHGPLRAWLVGLLDVFLTSPRDRELFDLPPADRAAQR